MANYYGNARSNYFKVKDVEAFKKEFIDKINGLEFIENNVGVGFLVTENDCGGIPCCMVDPKDPDNIKDIDLAEELSKHLADGEVAIYQEVGAEKLRYLTGYAVAVNSKGETVTVSISDIYQMAKSLTEADPTSITKCEY